MASEVLEGECKARGDDTAGRIKPTGGRSLEDARVHTER
jgi:hypothetical protein